jgi:hypothetical protein
MISFPGLDSTTTGHWADSAVSPQEVDGCLDNDSKQITNITPQSALDTYPAIFSRYKLFPESRNSIYACDVHSNIWYTAQAIDMERKIVNVLHADNVLSTKQKKFIGSRRGWADISRCVLTGIYKRGRRLLVDSIH